MSKIQSIKKIIVEDFPADLRDTVTKLASVLNPFLDQVSSALSSKLSYADNIQCQKYDFQLAADVSTIVLAWGQAEKPSAVYIGNLTKTNGEAPSAAFSLSSYHSDKKITMTFLGLAAGTAHNVTVIAQI
jgi:hypothetical protein